MLDQKSHPSNPSIQLISAKLEPAATRDVLAAFYFNKFLEIVLGSLVLCTVIYWLGMLFSRRAGVYVLSRGGLARDSGRTVGFRDVPENRHLRTSVRFRQLTVSHLNIVRIALLLSLKSLLYFKFGEFDVGNWIQLLQARKMEFRTSGWIKTLSAVQSLFGLAMGALALLSGLGKVFE